MDSDENEWGLDLDENEGLDSNDYEELYLNQNEGLDSDANEYGLGSD